MPKNADRFHGLMTFVDPKDIPAGFMVQQRNIGCFRPGRLDVRKGIQPITVRWDSVSPSGTSDAISCNCFVTPQYRFIVYEKDDGSVKAIRDGGSVSSIVTGLNTFQPLSCCRDSYGALLMVNGLERGYRWDGVAATADQIGIVAPAAGPTISKTGTASTMTEGTYYFAYRYRDRNGFFSNLSPITEVDYAAADLDSPDWSDLTASGESRVTTVELFRSTADAPHLFYKIGEVTSGTTTFADDDFTDDQLLLFDPEDWLPLREEDQVTIHANRFGLPPDHKPFIAQYQDVTFYYGRVHYNEGTVSGSSGSATVTGSGTAFRSEFVGRKIRIAGNATRYTIATVNEGAQTMTVSPVLSAVVNAGTSFVITPDESEINLLYYSGRGESEGVCEFSAQRVQDITEAQDLETGLFQFGPYLFILHEFHIYQVTFQRDPRYDLGIQLIGYRGAANHRLCVNAEGMPYFMDRLGVYRLNGGSPDDVSAVIRNTITDSIDWSDSSVKTYFSSYDPQERVVRFYVRYTGDTGTRPKRALCYNIEGNQWWDESYPYELSGACTITVDGRPRIALTSVDDTVYLQGEGYFDGTNTTIEWSLKTGMMNCAAPVVEGKETNLAVRRDLRLRYTPLQNPTSSANADLSLQIFANESATAKGVAFDHRSHGWRWDSANGKALASMDADQYVFDADPGYKILPLDEGFAPEHVADQFYTFSISGFQNGEQVSIRELELQGYV